MLTIIMINACLRGAPAHVKPLKLLVQLLSGLHRIYKLAIANLIHLLDDFLLIQTTESQCSRSLGLFLELCDFLSIHMEPENTFSPSTILTFAGVELGTIRCESRLPEDKLLKCKFFVSCSRLLVY